MSTIQIDTCRRFSAKFHPCREFEKVGLAIHTLGQVPVNGVRLQPEGALCGWFIWCGKDFSLAPDFFSPLHYVHLPKYLPQLIPYLGLAPGHRILIAPGHEDVWYDSDIV